ncbi:MAG TPA: hypothetical protein DCY56_05925 [Candidatus Omnitrophica bacterium]|nr:hypothetical protein [Candidatus Omnitrophota bacterium]
MIEERNNSKRAATPSYNKNQVIIINPLPLLSQMRNSALFLPLGALYIADALLDAGYNVSIINTDNEKALAEIKKIISKNLLCFCISTMSGTQLINAVVIAKALKTKYIGVPLIWGGPHITALPRQTLESNLVDYICWGEGEETISPLLDSIKSNNNASLFNMPGIGFKNKKSIIVGKNAGYSYLLKIFHLPYHLLDMSKYSRQLAIGAEKEFPILTSRGCPFRCKFCSNSSVLWPNTKIRFHTIDNIVNDIKTLVREYGADMITFADDGFLYSEKRLINILSAVREEGIVVKYRFAARADLLLKLKEETFSFMKEHGVVAIGFAPESGSQKILDYLGKNITIEQIYRIDRVLSRYKFYKNYNFMVCSPRETMEDLKLTLRMILDLARTSMYSPYPFGTLFKYIPLPGTELYEDAIKFGFKPPQTLNQWGEFDHRDIFDSIDRVRPWARKKNLVYMQKAIELVERLNFQMIGEGYDKRVVSEIFKEMDNLIERG